MATRKTLHIVDNITICVLYYTNYHGDDFLVGSFPVRHPIGRIGLLAAVKFQARYFDVENIEIDVGLDKAKLLLEQQETTTGLNCAILRRALNTYIKEWEIA